MALPRYPQTRQHVVEKLFGMPTRDRVAEPAPTDQIWCEVHEEIHAPVDDPYNMLFKLRGEKPECGPANWRQLLLGGRVA